MSSTNEIIQQIQNKVSQLIDMCQGEQAMQMTAYKAEANIWKQLLSIGASLLSLYFTSRAKAMTQKEWVNQDGETVPLHSQKKRRYITLFGELVIKRPWYYAAGQKGISPLEDKVQMPKTSYSDLVKELHGELVVKLPYQQVTNMLGKYLNLKLSNRVVQGFVAEVSREMGAYQYPNQEEEAPILVTQADGKGIPLVQATQTKGAVRAKRGQARSRKKEAIVTTVYSTYPQQRTAQQVIDSLFNTPSEREKSESKQTRPHHKMIWGTLQGKEVALNTLQQAVARREKRVSTPFQAHIALTDGAPALQYHVQDKLPHFKLVLDFIHAIEYLWKAGNLLFGEEDPKREGWVKEQALLLLQGKTAQLITHLEELASQLPLSKGEKLTKIKAYFERNRPYLLYDKCLAHGWPIASGVIEGACRHVVKDRFELSGMRWRQEQAEALLGLRCIDQSGCLDDYFRFRRASIYHRSPLAC